MLQLESLALFRGLRPDELTALGQIARERHFAAGSDIFHEGDPGDGVYFVKSGRVAISCVVGGNHRRVISQLGPGEIFGEMAVIEHRPRSATASAVEDTDVFFLPRGEMLSFIERSPALAFDLLKHISHRLRDFDQLYLREVLEAERLAVVGSFARSIVHDLKNPLNIIGLSAEMADRPDARPENRSSATRRIRKMVERITDLVGDILIFTEGKRTDVDAKPADYRRYVLDLLPELRAEMEPKEVRLEAGEPPAVTVQFNPRRLSRVFYNLIHNAADMMPTGGVISLRFQSEGKEIITEIEDTGPGIAPEIAGQLFKAFATFGKEHGTGLGLSICKKIVEDHGGRIWARNQPGRGAVFDFALPLAQ